MEWLLWVPLSFALVPWKLRAPQRLCPGNHRDFCPGDHWNAGPCSAEAQLQVPHKLRIMETHRAIVVSLFWRWSTQKALHKTVQLEVFVGQFVYWCLVKTKHPKAHEVTMCIIHNIQHVTCLYWPTNFPYRKYIMFTFKWKTIKGKHVRLCWLKVHLQWRVLTRRSNASLCGISLTTKCWL